MISIFFFLSLSVLARCSAFCFFFFVFCKVQACNLRIFLKGKKKKKKNSNPPGCLSKVDNFSTVFFLFLNSFDWGGKKNKKKQNTIPVFFSFSRAVKNCEYQKINRNFIFFSPLGAATRQAQIKKTKK